MDRAARLAALNSYVYTVPPNELDQKLGKAGLRLLAQGHNIYTRWFVAEGRLPHVLARRPSESKEDSEAEAALTPLTAEPRPFDRKTRQLQLKLEPELGSDWGIERLVFTRGVVWRDPNVKLPSLWQVWTHQAPVCSAVACCGLFEELRVSCTGIPGQETVGCWKDVQGDKQIHCPCLAHVKSSVFPASHQRQERHQRQEQCFSGPGLFKASIAALAFYLG